MKNRINLADPGLNLQDLRRQLGETRIKIALLQAALLETEEAERQSVLNDSANSGTVNASTSEKVLNAIREETRRLQKLSKPSIFLKITMSSLQETNTKRSAILSLSAHN